MPMLADTLKQAVSQNIITKVQFNQIMALYDDNTLNFEHDLNQPKFKMAHLLYYFGGFIAIAAMSWLITLGFEQFGGIGIMVISVCYALIGMLLADRFKRQNLMIPHSILLAFVLVLVPLFVFGLQQTLGVWSEEYQNYRDYHTWISWQWIFMELSTLAVGAIMMWRYKRAFVMFPIAVTLWYLSMDVAPFLNDGVLDWALRRTVSIYFGLAITLLALFIDFRQIDREDKTQDYSFWLYIIGALTFWCALTFNSTNNEWLSFGYFVINLVMMFFGLVIQRRVFVVLSGLGSCVYFSHLAWDVFENSMLFPLVLAFIGFAIIYLGVLWQRHEHAISNKLLNFLPKKLQQKIQVLQKNN